MPLTPASLGWEIGGVGTSMRGGVICTVGLVFIVAIASLIALLQFFCCVVCVCVVMLGKGSVVCFVLHVDAVALVVCVCACVFEGCHSVSVCVVQGCHKPPASHVCVCIWYRTRTTCVQRSLIQLR